jgi:hypothetical protein
VLDAIKARDEYNDRIAIDRDPQKNGPLYAFQSADLYFIYGDFENAKKRFKPMYDQYCGVNEWGYKAWEKLISMSNFEGDAAQSRKLAEGKSCAYDAETQKAEESIRKPVQQGVAYLDARKLYEEAEKMPEGPERNKKWRESARARRGARGGYERRLRLQAGRRVRQGDRNVRAVHLALRQREDPRHAQEW